MTLFNKLLSNYAFDTTLGVSVQEIKDLRNTEEPNISVFTSSYSYSDGVKKAHLKIKG
jgi:hypothetical protein